MLNDLTKLAIWPVYDDHWRKVLYRSTDTTGWLGRNLVQRTGDPVVEVPPQLHGEVTLTDFESPDNRRERL